MASADTNTVASPLSGTPPVFLKADDLINSQLKDYKICKALTDIIGPEQLIGLQRIGKLWRIYPKSMESRIKLVTNSVQLEGQTVPVYVDNPYRTGAHDPDQQIIKITIRDLPLSKGNDAIQRYLDGKGIKLTKAVEYGKIRDGDTHQLLPVLSGDRFCYAEQFTTPIPRVVFIGDQKVRVFHQGQESPIEKLCTKCFATDHFRSRCTNAACCVRCRKPGHNPGDTCCEASLEAPQSDIQTVHGKDDILSNFYPCEIKVFGVVAKSAEHAYQYTKAIRRGEIDQAKKILEARNASEAKYQSRFLKPSSTWKTERDDAMTQVLSAKAHSVPEFRDALLKTGKRKLVETVRNETYWASGLDQQDTLHTKPEFWMGKNRMGDLLMDLRKKLSQKAKNTQWKVEQNQRSRRETRSVVQGQEKKTGHQRKDAANFMSSENDDDDEEEGGSS